MHVFILVLVNYPNIVWYRGVGINFLFGSCNFAKLTMHQSNTRHPAYTHKHIFSLGQVIFCIVLCFRNKLAKLSRWKSYLGVSDTMNDSLPHRLWQGCAIGIASKKRLSDTNSLALSGAIYETIAHKTRTTQAIGNLTNKLAKLGKAIAISNLKLSTHWPTDMGRC